MSKKIWKKILLALSILFVLYNAVWSVYVALRYEPFCKELGSEVGTGMDYLQRNGYTYSVHKPPYLSFTGNLSITENIVYKAESSETITVDLTIWPRGIDDYEVGVGIVQTTINYGTHSINSICTQMMLDESLNLLDNTPENRKLYEENLDKIEKLYSLAYEIWGILELKQGD